MGFHNINEDIVIAQVNALYDFINKNSNLGNICSCTQCRTDVICYVLNRIKPHYIVSNRGLARAEQESITYQQKTADIVALAYEGIRQIHHRMRPSFGHYTSEDTDPEALSKPVFNIPIIRGRLFNGLNFAPMEDVTIELWHGKKLVPMVDNNWQNPYTIVAQTMGVFTFWPRPLLARGIAVHRRVGFSLKVVKAGFEELDHRFVISAVSAVKCINALSMKRIVKLPDLYLFPPEETEDGEFLPYDKVRPFEGISFDGM
jgi:competence protein ComFB